jgi:hypothetical protein
LKPVAWAKKMPRFSPEPAYPSKLLIARITQPIRARKPGWFRTDSGTSYRLSKSVPPCPAERHYHSRMSMPNSCYLVNAVSRRFSAFSTAFRLRDRGLRNFVGCIVEAFIQKRRLSTRPRAWPTSQSR